MAEDEKQNEIFSFYNQHQRAAQYLSTESAKFLWFQLFKDVILCLSQHDHAKKEMIATCRQYYQDDRKTIREIDDFERNYHRDNAIFWYTKNIFLYRLINTALRTQGIEQLYTFRYYIADLSKQLRAEFEKMKQAGENRIELFRGTHLTRNEAEQVKANAGQLIATNVYWSTSRNGTRAENFINTRQNSDQVAVFFRIKCDMLDEHSSVVFADVAQYSDFPEEEEVLFDIGAVFRIECVGQETINNTDVLVVHMKTTNEGKEVLEEYQNQNRREMEVESPTIMLCTLLKRMGKSDQSRWFLQRLLDNPNGENLVHIHNRLGIAYKDEDQYDRALEHFDKALQLTDFSDLSQRIYAAYILHNKGLLYAKRKQFHQALGFYRKAIEALDNEIDRPNTGIAQFLSSTGRVYSQQRRYKEALQRQEEALQMREQCLPLSDEHLVLAFSYADIANIYQHQRDYKQALRYRKKALDLRQKYLLPNNHNIAWSLRDVGKSYSDMRQYEQARHYYVKSLEIHENYLSISFYDSRASTLEDIARTYDASAPAEALRYRLDALETQRQVEPVNHSTLIYRLDQLVATCERLNNIDDSLQYAKQALEIQRSIQPIDYLAVSQRLDRLGFMCKKLNNLDDALMYYEDALNIRQTHLSDDRWYLACSWKNVATVYEQMGNHRHALDSYKRAWNVYHGDYKHDHSFCQKMSKNMARIQDYS